MFIKPSQNIRLREMYLNKIKDKPFYSEKKNIYMYIYSYQFTKFSFYLASLISDGLLRLGLDDLNEYICTVVAVGGWGMQHFQHNN
jgi:hypothetical protein